MKKNAFTLIEILVVIVIIGILATIGVAQFNDYQEKARFARAQAFATQLEKKIQIDFENQYLLLNMMESSLVDISSNKNNNNSSGGTITTDGTVGAYGSGKSILAPFSSGVISNLKNMPTESFTLSTWIKRNDDTDNINANTYPFYQGGGAYINVRWGLEMPDTKTFRAILSNGTKEYMEYQHPTDLNDNKWHHIAIMYDTYTKSHKFHFDGVLVKTEDRTTSAPTTILSQSPQAYIGVNSGQINMYLYNLFISTEDQSF
jgi:prepilin-type N-terminal cleavage/methylation domain-containing protein